MPKALVHELASMRSPGAVCFLYAYGNQRTHQYTTVQNDSNYVALHTAVAFAASEAAVDRTERRGLRSVPSRSLGLAV